MKNYQVSIERNGVQIPVGAIVGESHKDARFAYDLSYLSEADAVPVSISLPLQSEPFSAERTKAFFDGLLPEGFTRQSVAQWMHLDAGDYLSVLCGLGRECLGALQITDGLENVSASYERITEDQVRKLAAEGAAKSAELVAKAHLSLTGASGKVGLYFNEPENMWYLPKGTAPSTHIVKQSHVRLNGIVANEQLSLLTAAECGIDIPQSFIINTGSGRDGEVLLATRRYDRVFDGRKRIGALPCPMRLHQEDFAQAMGVAAAKKYERRGEAYLRKMFQILRAHSADPMTDTLKLWDAVIFDYLIGNTDAHIKNFSLLYSSDMKEKRLAPIYDIVSTVIYESSTRDMAFSIGDIYSIDEIGEESLRKAAADAGIGRRIAMKRFNALRESFCSALKKSAGKLVRSGFDSAALIAAKIVRSGGIAKWI
ncbi:HipA domain-containing protein [bacterium]|nr:HipA domain-containing protein [bacterium]